MRENGLSRNLREEGSLTMKPRRVVITGIGVIAPNGIGKEAFWDALVNGRSGIARITSFDPSNLPTQIAGEVRDFNPSDFIPNEKWQTMGRQTQMALAAAVLAAQDAGLEPHTQKVRACCFVGTSNPSYDLIETEFLKFTGPAGLAAGASWAMKSIDPFSPASAVSSFLGISGTSTAMTTSCTAGLNSVGHAFWELKKGTYDLAVAGSVDCAIFPITFLFFCAAGIMSKRNDEPDKASRPFDTERDGGVLSEGAALLVLEPLELALARGAPIYAEVIGYGESSLSTDPRRTKEGFATAITKALQDAKLHPDQIDYVAAHAPSDPMTDVIETEALKQVFRKHAYRFAISSIKSMIGNPQSAAGPMQVIASAIAMSAGILPPTINLHRPDPCCDLDYVPNEARRASPAFVLINSHGINGTDAALILANPKLDTTN